MRWVSAIIASYRTFPTTNLQIRALGIVIRNCLISFLHFGRTKHGVTGPNEDVD